MTKNLVVKEVADRIKGASQKDVAVVLDTFADVIADVLKADHDESVAVGKLGKFKVKEVPARDGVSAINGKAWHTDAHSEITFKMSKTAKQL